MIPLFAVTSLALAGDPAVTSDVKSDASVEPDAPKSPWLDLAHLQCRHAFGVAGGSYYGNLDWEAIGNAWGTTFSPVYQAECVEHPVDNRARHAWIGVDSAPWYVQFRTLDGVSRHEWAAAVLGVAWGHDLQVGPAVTFGYAGLGAGIAARSMSPRTAGVIEARVTAYGPRPGVQALVTYGRVPRNQRK